MRAALAAAVAAVLLDSEQGVRGQQGGRTDAQVDVPPSKSLAALLVAGAGVGSHGFVATTSSFASRVHKRPQMVGNFLPEDAQEVEGDYKARVGTGPQMAGNSLPEDAQEVGEYEALVGESAEERRRRELQARAARQREEMADEEKRLQRLRQPKEPSLQERFSDIWDDAGKAFLGRVTAVETGKASPVLRQRTDAVFTQYDVDGSGGIDAAELKDATARLGFAFTEEQIQRMLAEVDENEDGVISPEEFYTLILAQETPMERAQREQKEMAEQAERRRLMIQSAEPKKETVLGVEIPEMKMPTPCISKLDCESPDQCCDFGPLGLWCANPAKFFGYCPVAGAPRSWAPQLQPIPIPVERGDGQGYPRGVPPPRGLPPPGPGPGPGGYPF